MKRLVGLTLLLPGLAQAAWPNDITLSKMTEHGGLRVVDTDLLGADYQTLVAELGTAIANKPLAPAETLGASGFDFSFSNSFVFVLAHRNDGTPSPWERAHENEDPSAYLLVPTISARKGLPFSLEAGANLSWIAMSRNGSFGGYGRLSIVEGYKPAPDLTIQIGYAGYVGNDEIEVGVMDMGVTLGSTFAFGTFPGINSSQFSPYLNFTLLRITAAPLIDEAMATKISAAAISGKDAITLPQVAGGFQITNGTFLMRILGAWAPTPAPPESLEGEYPRRGVPQAAFSVGWQY